MIDECGDGGYNSSYGGIITSPSYPNNYPDNADCIYSISQPTGTVILLNFFSMDIGTKWDGTCNNDYLEIRDGSSAHSPFLKKLCGNEIPSSIQSSQNQLWIRWWDQIFFWPYKHQFIYAFGLEHNEHSSGDRPILTFREVKCRLTQPFIN